MQRRVLYIDPDPDDRERFATAAEAAGITAITSDSVEDGLRQLEGNRIDVVVSEAKPDVDAVTELFTAVSESDHSIPCIVFTDKEIDTLIDAGIVTQASALRSKDGVEAFDDLMAEITEYMRPRSDIDYPVPDDEEERLAAVGELDIDRLRDRTGFQRLTKIAKEFFDVRQAFVGIVESDTEQFLSFEGDEVRELARECSICTFGIMDSGTTVVDDRRADERFKYIDELEDLDIVFYAGHPLEDADGRRIGMFCIMDDKERDFTADDRQHLRLFAEEAMELIRLYQEEIA